jgi:hypothetical protein
MDVRGQAQQIFGRQLKYDFMGYPILDPDDRPMRSAVHREHNLVFAKGPAFVHDRACLPQLLALH